MHPPIHPRCLCAVEYHEIEPPPAGRVYGKFTNSKAESLTSTYGNVKVKVETGAEAGALDPDSTKALEHAVRYYESVRHMKTDCSRIAQNTGFRKEDIQQIKSHVFIEEHELADGKGRFFEDYEMSQSWQRLIEGKNVLDKDIVLLNHEFLELTLMKAYGLSYEEAHKATEKVYNYKKLIMG